MSTHPHVICLLGSLFQASDQTWWGRESDKFKNRNTWGRQVQARPRAAVGRGAAMGPRRDIQWQGDRPLYKYSAYLREQTSTWPEVGILGNRTCGRYILMAQKGRNESVGQPLSRACLNGIILEDWARPACKDWRGRSVCILTFWKPWKTSSVYPWPTLAHPPRRHHEAAHLTFQPVWLVSLSDLLACLTCLRNCIEMDVSFNGKCALSSYATRFLGTWLQSALCLWVISLPFALS